MLSNLELVSHIDSIIATTDFSKLNFKKKDEIDLSKFDLSKLPVADFNKLNNTVDLVHSKMDEYGAMINCSRMCEQNKKNGTDRISLIKSDIALYKKDNTDSEKIRTAWYISSRMFDLVSFVPTKLKSEVTHIHHRLEADIKEINPIVESRQFLINKLSDGLVEKSKDFRVRVLKDGIKKNGLTVDDIKNTTSETDNDFICAARWYAGEEFSRGAADIVSAVWYAEKLGNAIPEVSWMFSDQVEGAINFAKKIGLKELAFEGDSTAALSNLNIITKMGLKFRIEEITRNNGYGDTETKPVAIVSVF